MCADLPESPFLPAGSVSVSSPRQKAASGWQRPEHQDMQNSHIMNKFDLNKHLFYIIHLQQYKTVFSLLIWFMYVYVYISETLFFIEPLFYFIVLFLLQQVAGT